MGFCVCGTAMLTCSFGAAPTPLTVLPIARVMSKTPLACILDHIPIANLAPFGVCSSMANPTVAAATAAKLGVMTPMPCLPVPAGTWLPGSPTVLIGGKPALNNSSKLMCAWGGVIQITQPGTMNISMS